jgi:hypothetical protein
VVQRVEYGKPRRLNWFSGTLILLAVGFGYFMWRFFPYYLDAWTVDHVLRETATAVYRANRMNEPDRTTTLRQLLDKAKEDIRKQAGIQDPELTVGVDIEGDSALMSAEYSVVVTHPLVDRTTRLHFHREEKADIKRVDWDKP